MKNETNTSIMKNNPRIIRKISIEELKKNYAFLYDNGWGRSLHDKDEEIKKEEKNG